LKGKIVSSTLKQAIEAHRRAVRELEELMRAMLTKRTA
jgi:hypothetical protein